MTETTQKTDYIPENPEHRRWLAKEILELMEYAGFTEQENSGEKVFFRQVQEGVKVMVYTTIVNDQVRDKDADAIRVCGVYTKRDGEERGIVKSSRVYRTGKLGEIPERLLERMREVWRKVKHVERCNQCGAPKFTSKKGNLVCCETCYLKDKEKP